MTVQQCGHPQQCQSYLVVCFIFLDHLSLSYMSSLCMCMCRCLCECILSVSMLCIAYVWLTSCKPGPSVYRSVFCWMGTCYSKWISCTGNATWCNSRMVRCPCTMHMPNIEIPLLNWPGVLHFMYPHTQTHPHMHRTRCSLAFVKFLTWQIPLCILPNFALS